jgi:hypothetical protein
MLRQIEPPAIDVEPVINRPFSALAPQLSPYGQQGWFTKAERQLNTRVIDLKSPFFPNTSASG